MNKRVEIGDGDVQIFNQEGRLNASFPFIFRSGKLLKISEYSEISDKRLSCIEVDINGNKIRIIPVFDGVTLKHYFRVDLFINDDK